MSIRTRVNKLEDAANTDFVVGWLRNFDADDNLTDNTPNAVAVIKVNDTAIERQSGETLEALEARVRRLAVNELGVSACIPWIPGDEKL